MKTTIRRTITYFNRDSKAPISLTVLLDVSGSMALQDKFKESREALRYLVTSLLGPQDEVSLLIFADGEVEVASEFSTDKTSFPFGSGQNRGLRADRFERRRRGIAGVREQREKRETSAPAHHGRHRERQPKHPGSGP